MFLLRIYSDLKYEVFHCGVKINIYSLTYNKISHLSRWSQIEEALRELNFRELYNKQNIINQQIQATGSQTIGQVKYSPDVIIRAFKYLQHDVVDICSLEMIFSCLLERI